MSSVHIKSNIDIALEDLLQGVVQLEGKELDSFIQQLLSFRARQKVGDLDQRQAELLELINQTSSLETSTRYKELNERRQAEVLTKEEQAELIEMTTEREAQNVERIKHLSELALLQKTDLRSLMKRLGLITKNG